MIIQHSKMSCKKRKPETSENSKSKRPCAWLTLDQKIEIIKKYESGVKCSKIASEMGKNESSIRTIISKKDECTKLSWEFGF